LPKTKIVRWAAFALRPLTILEITEALLIADDDNCDYLLVDELPDTIDEDYVSSEVRGLCGSLLETQKATLREDLGSMTIHFAHFSAREYIIRNIPAEGGLLMVNERLWASNEMFQNNILAKLCLRHLNFWRVWQESPQLESGPRNQSFRDYAAGSWYHHYGECGSNYTEVGPRNQSFRDYAAGSWYHHYGECGSNYTEVVELTNTFFSPNNRNWESWKRWFDANDDKSEMPISQKDITSSSLLFYVSLLGLRDTIIYLLEAAKLDVNHVDEFNRTALQAASLKGRTLVLKLLLENGAHVTVANNEGWTPLMWASFGGHVDAVNLLLEKGADVTVGSNNGYTPLNLAPFGGQVEAIKLLLENGADVTVANKGGWTPLPWTPLWLASVLCLLQTKDPDRKRPVTSSSPA
jgi:hypothetical protein